MFHSQTKIINFYWQALHSPEFQGELGQGGWPSWFTGDTIARIEFDYQAHRVGASFLGSQGNVKEGDSGGFGNIWWRCFQHSSSLYLNYAVVNQELPEFLVKGSRANPGSNKVASDDEGAEQTRTLKSEVSRNHVEALDFQKPGNWGLRIIYLGSPWVPKSVRWLP